MNSNKEDLFSVLVNNKTIKGEWTVQFDLHCDNTTRKWGVENLLIASGMMRPTLVEQNCA